MKWFIVNITACICLAAGLFGSSVMAQSLIDKLKQEDNFYTNYGKDLYSKYLLQKDVVSRYDYFGDHIVDGIHLYDLSGSNLNLTNEREGVKDSVAYSRSTERQTNDFYEKFSNLVVTQDAIGGVKTAFMIGDQITTKFTPLTFNMTNFRGIRWDTWSSGLQMSLLLTRTRPGFLSKKGTTGEATVEYPISDNSIPQSYYGQGFRGNNDWTSKSPYGDYDFLWAVHAQNTIANQVDVGLTYINHHVNDVKRGAQLFKGELPDSLMPNFIHFEFYDGTPQDSADAGVFVENLQMFINGQPVKAKDVYRDKFRRVFVGDRDGVLLPREIPMARPQNGTVPIIAEFAIDPTYWQYDRADGSVISERDIRAIKEIKFTYTIAGNYLVFVSTDRQIPLGINGKYNQELRRVDYSYPTKPVGDIYDQGIKVNAAGSGAVANGYSTTYYGEYVAQSSRKISAYEIDAPAFETVCRTPGGLSGNSSKYNYKSYDWEYGLNESSVTYGVNFKGELGGVKFSGELALNQSEKMLPGVQESRKTDNRIAGNLKADRDIGKNFGVNAEAYYISPQWATNLSQLQASRYFSQTYYKSDSVPDYMVSPRPLNNEWQNIEDNNDGDAYPENARRHYPAEQGADAQNQFNADGTMKPPRIGGSSLKQLYLPENGMAITYDDQNGVTASKTDRNKNGTPDYIENFLLFESDPPVFELGQDLNNNGIPDYEDDDFLPDFGHAVGYTITGDGYLTQGIRGLTLTGRWNPMENTIVECGTVLESVPDRDLMATKDGGNNGLKGVAAMEGKSYVGFLTAKQEVVKRSQGLQYNLGAELRYVRDAIRNDEVSTDYQTGEKEYNVSYYYRIDPLAYRNAVVGNLVGNVNYINIRNFEYGFKIRLGAEKHFLIEDNIDGARSPVYFYSPDDFDNKWKIYPSRLIGLFDVVNKMQYHIKFNPEYDDWRSMFNFVSRFEIIPQYKLAFSFKREFQGPAETRTDPRSLRDDLAADKDGNGTIDPLLDVGVDMNKVAGIKSRWDIYRRNNEVYLLNVPILRVNYKLAESTQLQGGVQWLRLFDVISPEANLRKFSVLGQVVSKANYKGNSVTFLLGFEWENAVWDVIARDPVLDQGSMFNQKFYTFFAKIYSGI